MHLPEKGIELLAERALLARGLTQHGVDHFHGGVGIAQKRGKLRRVNMQNTQQRVDLGLRLSLRGLQFAGEIHPSADIRYRHQHMRDFPINAHAMELKLQAARGDFTLPAVEVDLNLAEW